MSELEVLVNKVSRDLQEIHNLLLGEGKVQEPGRLGIRFPRGYIRRLNEFEERLPFVADPILKKTYLMQFSTPTYFDGCPIGSI